MRKTLLLTVIFLATVLTFAVHAQPTDNPTVSSKDLTSVGYTSVSKLARDGTRFHTPVRYFRVAETLSDTDTPKDCDDCANLVAVYIARASSVPGWSIDNSSPLRIVGGRVQARRYHTPTNTILIVTGPGLEKVSALSDLLLKRVAGKS